MKNKIFFFVLVIAVITLMTSCRRSPDCYETDMGLDSSVQGTTTLMEGHTDYCNGQKVVEYGCDINVLDNDIFFVGTSSEDLRLKYERYNPGDGTILFTKTSDDEMLEFGVGSDDYFNMIVSGMSFRFKVLDPESGNSPIRAYNHEIILEREFLCNYSCMNGACMNFTNQTNCTDSDGGLNIYIKGNCTQRSGQGGGGVVDYCLDEHTVRECYCENDVLRSYDLNCTDRCVDGFCLNG